ncbi:MULTISPECIES: phosphopantetheine-binding protein [unclassified Crossiella]|uniref:phosphopantetheine-binding protein n=1 Tax=unclassified Crossiella TaxID=2620835 RepID=UPI001FFF495A|nr:MULTISPECIES: phosphopantetheine-binding protein [unclassified Crossiella]MCK2243117.1 phosphopantetheine-binding protein [Crossiella sp. S99.2]MCK2256994.1 phosphopantetheine-binding protein [Crossiella sp. S99.1]
MTHEAVLSDIGVMLHKVLGEYGLDEVEVTMDSTFHDDLELESIDLVALAGQLEERYGARVNFAEFIAELELDQIIALTVGQLVDYVVGALDEGN